MFDVVTYETQEHKPYVTGVERISIRSGMQQALYEMLLVTLETRFGAIPDTLIVRLQAVSDTDKLKDLHQQALLADSLDDFEQHLPE